MTYQLVTAVATAATTIPAPTAIPVLTTILSGFFCFSLDAAETGTDCSVETMAAATTIPAASGLSGSFCSPIAVAAETAAVAPAAATSPKSAHGTAWVGKAGFEETKPAFAHGG